MRVVFFILLIIFIALAVLILLGNKYKVLFLVSSKQKSAYYTLNHRIFTLVQGKVLILEDGSISVITRKNKMIKKEVPSDYSREIAKEILGIMRLTRLDVYLNSGRVGDAFTTAITMGLGEIMGGVMTSILTNKEVETEFHHISDGNSDEFSVAVNLNVRITLLSLIFAIFRAKKNYNKIKEKRYAEQN